MEPDTTGTAEWSPLLGNSDAPRMEIGIGVGQLRAAPFSYLRRVANGETLRVLRRGQLVATLDSIGNSMDENIATTGGRFVRVPVSYLRASAGRLLDRVQDGDTIEIVYRGKPLARINPVDTSSETRRDDLSASSAPWADAAMSSRCC